MEFLKKLFVFVPKRSKLGIGESEFQNTYYQKYMRDLIRKTK